MEKEYAGEIAVEESNEQNITPKYIIRKDEENNRYLVRQGARTKFLYGDEYNNLKKEVEELRLGVGKVLGSRGGYLHSNDREDMTHIYSNSVDEYIGEIVFEERNIEEDKEKFKKTSKRANILAKHLPRIFDSQYESTHEFQDENGRTYYAFPTVDSVINIFNGAEGFNGGFAKRTSLDEIMQFSDLALGPFSEQTKQELLEKVAGHYKFQDEGSKEYVIQKVAEAFDMLTKEINPETQGSLISFYKGEGAEEIVQRPFWYAHFDSESVQKIIKDYWENFENLPRENIDEKKINASAKLARLFPESIPESKRDYFSTKKGVTSYKQNVNADFKIGEMIDSGDYSNVNGTLLKNCSLELREKLFENLEKYILGNFDLNMISMSRENILKAMNLPANASGEIDKFYDETFDVLTGVLGNRIRRLDIGSFLSLVNEHSRTRNQHTRSLDDVIFERVNSPEFNQETAEYIKENAPLEALSNSTMRARKRVGLGNNRFFDPVANQVIDEALSRKVSELNDSEFISFVNENYFKNGREQSREYVIERIGEIIGESLSQGKSLREAMKENGFTRVPSYVEWYFRKSTVN